ncbi:MAG: YceI family protein [Bacteriovoracaceae bacterium]
MKIILILSATLLLSYSVYSKTECRYQIDSNDIKLEWTGFKTSEKAGVNGTFKKAKFKFKENAKTIEELITNSTATIEAGSIFTNNLARDTNLTMNFFSKIVDSANISGSIKKIQGDDKKGTFNLLLTFNKMTNPISMEYVVNKDEIVANGSMDLLTFKADTALASLNQACSELHKGKDGLSKTWPEVLIKITAKFRLECI